MKILKKIACLMLCLCMVLPFAACSGVNTTPVFTYENVNIGSDYYSMIFSYEKGFYTYLFQYYYGIDLSAQPNYWDLDFTEGVTQADSVVKDINEYCKMIVVTDYLFDKYQLSLTDEEKEEIEKGIDDLQNDYGGEDMFIVELAKLGCNMDTLRRFMYDSAKTDIVRDYLYGENGTQKIPASEIEAEFLKTYRRVDSMSFGFNKADDTTNRWLGDFTDNEISGYFTENYRVVDYLFYAKGKNETDEDYKARVEAVYASLKSGEKAYDDVKAEADNKYKDWAVSSSDISTDFFTAVDALEIMLPADEESDSEQDISKCVTMVSDKEGLHIFIRKPMSASLLDDDIKEDCVKAMSTQYVKDYAAKYLEDVKSGDKKFGENEKTEFYSVYVPQNIFTEEDMDATLNKLYEEASYGEYFVYTTSSGVFVCRKVELTADDLSTEISGSKVTYYDEIESALADDAFYKFIESFYDSIVINEKELGKYDIRTALEFGNW